MPDSSLPAPEPERLSADEWERDDRDWTDFVEVALDPKGAAHEVSRSYAECRLLREAFTAIESEVRGLRRTAASPRREAPADDELTVLRGLLRRYVNHDGMVGRAVTMTEHEAEVWTRALRPVGRGQEAPAAEAETLPAWDGLTCPTCGDRTCPRATDHRARCAASSDGPAAPTAEPERCPDGGACHHDCDTPTCFRVVCCEPLSGVYPGNRWPVEVTAVRGPAESAATCDGSGEVWEQPLRGYPCPGCPSCGGTAPAEGSGS